jgi:uncharacterized protein
MKNLFLVFIFLSLNLFAQTTFPKLTGHVVDTANILSKQERSTIEEILTNHENNTSNQVIVVTLPSLNDKPIEEYALELGRHWGIGQKEKNNGVLLVIAMKERKLRIEVGYGLEGALTDKISHEIIEYIIKPKFKRKNYFEGIKDGVENILKAIKNEYKFTKNDQNSNFSYVFLGGFLFIVLSELVSKLFKFTKGRVFYQAILISIVTYFIALEAFYLSVMLSASLAIIVFAFFFYRDINSFDNTDYYSSSSSSSYEDTLFDKNIFSSSSSYSGGGGSFGGGGASGSW